MKKDINNYPGAKGGSGVRQALFNCIPETHCFVELFGGTGLISFELAKKETVNIIALWEKNPAVFDQLMEKAYKAFSDPFNRGVGLFKGDSLQFYKEEVYSHGATRYWGEVFFADPPYLFETRKSKRNIYPEEWTENDHISFLKFVSKYFPVEHEEPQAYFIITHPRCELYETYLKGWYSKDIEYMTRRGSMTDTIWMNYDITQLKLANTDYIGTNYKERQAFNRKKQRWSKRLNGMPLHEKQALVEHLAKEVKV